MKRKNYGMFVRGLVVPGLFFSIIGLGVFAQGKVSAAEETSPYFQSEVVDLPGGISFARGTINGPPSPPPGIERATTELPQSDKEAGVKTLVVPAFNWSFGCSATTAAMIAGYYDRGGYSKLYTGPTNGGLMPLNNSSWPDWVDGSGATRHQCPLSATHKGLDGRTTRGHVDDYWVAYNSSASDPFIGSWTQHSYGDCTGDYMKTNQSNYGNTDGGTTFWNYTDGSPYHAADMVTNGHHTTDGGYGFKLFVESRGYQVPVMYNQYIYGYKGNTKGFTFAQYKAQIDAGNPVLIHVEGHTMAGVGYNDSSNTVYLNDTWDYSTHTMTWGGSYSGMAHYAVTVINLKGGEEVPTTPKTSLVAVPMLLLKKDSSSPVSNGDFESGAVSWTESSTNGYSLIGQWGTARSGTWSTWLGGDVSETAYIQQQVTITSSSPYLIFYHWIYSEDSCGSDYGTVKINGTTVSSTDLCSSNNSSGWVKKSIDLSSYVGQAVTLQIRAYSDYSNFSNWFIDDVSFQASASASSGLEMESVSPKGGSAVQFQRKTDVMKRR